MLDNQSQLRGTVGFLSLVTLDYNVQSDAAGVVNGRRDPCSPKRLSMMDDCGSRQSQLCLLDNLKLRFQYFVQLRSLLVMKELRDKYTFTVKRLLYCGCVEVFSWTGLVICLPTIGWVDLSQQFQISYITPGVFVYLFGLSPKIDDKFNNTCLKLF